MVIDFKETIWTRIYVPDNDNGKEMIAHLKENKDINSLYNNFKIESSEILYELSKLMDVSENGDCATIELLDNDMKKVWDNTINSKKDENKAQL